MKIFNGIKTAYQALRPKELDFDYRPLMSTIEISQIAKDFDSLTVFIGDTKDLQYFLGKLEQYNYMIPNILTKLKLKVYKKQSITFKAII